MKRDYSYKAADGKAMTLGELRDLINDTADLNDINCWVKVRVTFGGGIKSITISEDRGG